MMRPTSGRPPLTCPSALEIREYPVPLGAHEGTLLEIAVGTVCGTNCSTCPGRIEPRSQSASATRSLAGWWRSGGTRARSTACATRCRPRAWGSVSSPVRPGRRRHDGGDHIPDGGGRRSAPACPGAHDRRRGGAGARGRDHPRGLPAPADRHANALLPREPGRPRRAELEARLAAPTPSLPETGRDGPVTTAQLAAGLARWSRRARDSSPTGSWAGGRAEPGRSPSGSATSATPAAASLRGRCHPGRRAAPPRRRHGGVGPPARRRPALHRLGALDRPSAPSRGPVRGRQQPNAREGPDPPGDRRPAAGTARARTLAGHRSRRYGRRFRGADTAEGVEGIGPVLDGSSSPRRWPGQ
jgi:hypothetical protein